MATVQEPGGLSEAEKRRIKGRVADLNLVVVVGLLLAVGIGAAIALKSRGRDTTTIQSALIGRWIETTGGDFAIFDGNKYRVIRKDGTKTTGADYSIQQWNDSEKVITLKLLSDSASEMSLKFSDDFTTLYGTHTVHIRGLELKPFSLNFRFVDTDTN